MCVTVVGTAFLGRGRSRCGQDFGWWSLHSSVAGASCRRCLGVRDGGSHEGKTQVRRERAKVGGVVDEAGPLESPPGKHSQE